MHVLTKTWVCVDTVGTGHYWSLLVTTGQYRPLLIAQNCLQMHALVVIWNKLFTNLVNISPP